ncbi:MULTISPECIES: glutaredoxin [Colwelliaceae]|uniref:glutaredoxin family protein n=1 Tax=Colwelliaceae TaxID=267889 RepID=UPI0009702487|nr:MULTISPECIES: glutaredoxin [Colwelliaceae]
MFIIRWILGRIILGLNFIFSPSSPKRDVNAQNEINAQTQHLSLYQLPACPFCVKVRRAIKRQGLQIDIRNIKDETYLNELVNEGGKRTVPCLKIAKPGETVTWLYESKDIINYLGKIA